MTKPVEAKVWICPSCANEAFLVVGHPACSRCGMTMWHPGKLVARYQGLVENTLRLGAPEHVEARLEDLKAQLKNVAGSMSKAIHPAYSGNPEQAAIQLAEQIINLVTLETKDYGQDLWARARRAAYLERQVVDKAQAKLLKVRDAINDIMRDER